MFFHGCDLNTRPILHGDAFQEFIGVKFSLFEFFYLVKHVSFLFFNLFFHQLSLIEQLLSLVFYNLSFHHFLLDLIEEFFLLIFLDFHDSFNVFLFVCPFDDILVVFFLQLLLSLPLNSDEIVLFGLKFLEHTFLIRLLLLFIIIPHPSSFLLLLFLLFSFLLGLDT